MHPGNHLATHGRLCRRAAPKPPCQVAPSPLVKSLRRPEMCDTPRRLGAEQVPRRPIQSMRLAERGRMLVVHFEGRFNWIGLIHLHSVFEAAGFLGHGSYHTPIDLMLLFRGGIVIFDKHDTDWQELQPMLGNSRWRASIFDSNFKLTFWHTPGESEVA